MLKILMSDHLLTEVNVSSNELVQYLSGWPLAKRRSCKKRWAWSVSDYLLTKGALSFTFMSSMTRNSKI